MQLFLYFDKYYVLSTNIWHVHDKRGPPVFTDMPSSQPIDIPDAKKRNKKKKRCRATDSFSGRFEGNCFHDYIAVIKPPYKTLSLEMSGMQRLHKTD